MRITILWLVTLLFAAPAAVASPEPAMSPTEAAAVRSAATRGAMIYAYDQAGWHGTDDLRAKMSDYRDKVGGWIVDGPTNAPELVFYDRDAAEPHALYVADFRDNALVSSRVLGSSDDRSLSASRKALISARRAALAAAGSGSEVKACVAQPFNPVVLPPETPGGPILVYLLTPQTRTDSIPFGAHYLIEVGANGKAAPPRRFTNSCLEMPSKPPQKDAAGIFVTHLLDPVPTEIHVFAAFVAHVPVFVGTVSNHHLWSVDREHIRLVSTDFTK